MRKRGAKSGICVRNSYKIFLDNSPALFFIRSNLLIVSRMSAFSEINFPSLKTLRKKVACLISSVRFVGEASFSPSSKIKIVCAART